MSPIGSSDNGADRSFANMVHSRQLQLRKSCVLLSNIKNLLFGQLSTPSLSSRRFANHLSPQVNPVFIPDNISNGAARDAKHACQFILTFVWVVRQYLQHVLFAELVVPFLSVSLPSFGNHIASILLRRPKPQVGWVATAGDVTAGAVVKNPKPMRDGSEMQHPRRLMRVNAPQSTPSSVYVPVPVYRQRPRPNPTGLGDVNLGEESSGEGGRKSLLLEKCSGNVRHSLVSSPVRGYWPRRASSL